MNHFVPVLCKQQIVTRFVSSLLLGLCLFPTIVLADDDQAPPSGRSSGGRGCGTDTIAAAPNVPALILLTPKGELGQTVSPRPTFAWFVRDAAPFPVEFRLYAQDHDKFTLVKEIKSDQMRSTPGIMVLPSASVLPALTVGKRYRWQVELVCNPSRPSSNLFAEAVIEVVPLQATLRSQLVQTHDRLDRAKLYAQANLWYDVLQTAFAAPSSTTQLQAFQLSLLDKVAIDVAERNLLRDALSVPSNVRVKRSEQR